MTPGTRLVLFCCFAAALLSNSIVVLGQQPCQSSVRISVNGVFLPELSADLLSMRFVDSEGQTEIRLNNWDAGTLKYSDGNLLVPGTKVGIAIVCGPTTKKLSEGIITVLGLSFYENGPPTVRMVVSERQASVKRGAALTLRYGAELQAFAATMKLGTSVTEGGGDAEGNADLRIGSLAAIQGVGERFEGAYSVTETVHAFDVNRGYVTSFVGVKR